MSSRRRDAASSLVRWRSTQASSATRMRKSGGYSTSLVQTDALDNTILFVLSDNGADGFHAEGGMPDRFTQLHDGRPALDDLDDLAGARGLYACGWAWAGNTPFRLWKCYTWL